MAAPLDRWAVLACMLTCAPDVLVAQGVTGAAVQGRVTDQANAPIAEATILVTNGSNGGRWQSATGPQGRFYLEHLSVGGPYIIEVRAVGFAPVRRDGVYLSLGQRLTTDFALRPAAVELEPITVTAAPDPRINAGRTGPEQVISESTIARLPMAGFRDVAEAVRIVPQVVRSPPGELYSPPGELSIAGQTVSLNSLQIDGATGNDLLSGAIATAGRDLGLRTIAVEALQELQVVSAPLDVRFGEFAGGLVNAVTKSGTNRFSGSLFGYFAAPGLVGKDPEGTRGGDFEAWEMGLTLGGPVVRDRAAFFVEAGFQHGALPQNFPLIGTDTTGGADSVGVGIRRASAERFQAILRDRYGVEGGSFATPIELSGTPGNLFAKATVQLGLNSRVEASHIFSRSVPVLPGAGCRAPEAFYCLSSRAFTLDVTTHATRLGWTGTIGHGVANELLLARLRFLHRCIPNSTFATLFVGADNGQLSAGTADFCLGERNQQEILELTDNLSFSVGSHRLVVGTHNELLRLPTRQFFQFGFYNRWEFGDLDSLEQGLADHYEATLPTSARTAGPLSDLRVTQLGFYLQDQWAPNSKLTLTGGIRLDVPFVSATPHPNPALREALKIDNTVSPSGNPLWSPRLGINYDLSGTGVTFLRGGIGLFAGRPAYDWFNNVYVHTGLDALHLDCSDENVPPFEIDLTRQPTTCGDGAASASDLVNFFDPGFRFPRSLKVAVGADRRLPWGMVGTVDLLYNRSLDQLDQVDVNLGPPTPQGGEDGRLLYGTIGADGQASPSRTSPAFNQVIQVRNAAGDRSFSATLQLQKRFLSATELAASYTRTSSRDRLSDVDGGLNGVANGGDLEARRLATSAWSVPHRVTLLASANLPLDIRLTLFYEGMSGGAYDYVVDGDANADGFGGDPLYVPADVRPGGDVSLVTETPGGWVAAPATDYQQLDGFIEGERCLQASRGRLIRRNTCRNPWVNHTEARFSKLFPTQGGQSLELIAEVFNLLHLLDSDWGLVRGIDGTGLLRLVGYDAGLGRGIYTLQIPRRRALDVDASRWRMQLGARYTF
jgi:hypothetical protein